MLTGLRNVFTRSLVLSVLAGLCALPSTVLGVGSFALAQVTTRTLDEFPTFLGISAPTDPFFTKHAGVTSQVSPPQFLIPSLFNPLNPGQATFGGLQPYTFQNLNVSGTLNALGTFNAPSLTLTAPLSIPNGGTGQNAATPGCLGYSGTAYGRNSCLDLAGNGLTQVGTTVSILAPVSVANGGTGTTSLPTACALQISGGGTWSCSASGNGGATNTTPFAAGASSGAVNAGSRRLWGVVITTVGTAAAKVRDTNSSGLILCTIPANAPIGSTCDDASAPSVGALYWDAGTNTPAVTVVWSPT